MRMSSILYYFLEIRMFYNLLTYFVRSGEVHLYWATVRFAGIRGYDWSNVSGAYSTINSASAYNLAFYTSSMYTSGDSFHRYQGFPVRCLDILVIGNAELVSNYSSIT